MKKKNKALKKIKRVQQTCQSLGKVQDTLWRNLIKDLKKDGIDEEHLDWVWDYVFNDHGYETLVEKLDK